MFRAGVRGPTSGQAMRETPVQVGPPHPPPTPPAKHHSEPLANDAEEPPFRVEALEFVKTSLGEIEAAPQELVAHG